jgi:hypothetical protein
MSQEYENLDRSSLGDSDPRINSEKKPLFLPRDVIIHKNKDGMAYILIRVIVSFSILQQNKLNGSTSYKPSTTAIFHLAAHHWPKFITRLQSVCTAHAWGLIAKHSRDSVLGCNPSDLTFFVQTYLSSPIRPVPHTSDPNDLSMWTRVDMDVLAEALCDSL